ncbi:hypothetical protein NTE_01341 [Candidatus Nitrososphaera evergladensis SR1]|uniref:Uncharacterized protein n=1 Tax=Candidatus Nitrososphaera evergladensis SR1 TaxID=1459636 RepID=A0A075MVS5_9ARCH|nr:hypothetical protein NTE_01341 [Candidatus Nitrososphaera evergladensis SR1]
MNVIGAKEISGIGTHGFESKKPSIVLNSFCG